jgi:hypothetical protein
MEQWSLVEIKFELNRLRHHNGFPTGKFYYFYLLFINLKVFLRLQSALSSIHTGQVSIY